MLGPESGSLSICLGVKDGIILSSCLKYNSGICLNDLESRAVIMNVSLAVYIAILISYAHSASESAPPPQETDVETTCSNELSDVEKIAQSRRLTESDWRMLRRVATLRSAKGLEVLPDMLGCPSLIGAASQLDWDPATAAMLRQSGYSSRDYIEIAWAVLIANDPESFGAKPNSTVAANMCFLAHRRPEVRALLDSK